MGGWMRHPRTLQELRANNGSPIPVRGGRKWLPTTWDDPWRRPLRSWKKQRPTHYRLR